MATLEDTDVDVIIDTEQGNHDKFSHYVRKEAILQAGVFGIPAIALCGKQWIPNSDPEKYPVCPECKEIFEDNDKLLNNEH